MLGPVWRINDKKARILIFGFSIVVFTAIMILVRVKLNINAGFDVHIFAKLNALLNSCVAILLIAALIVVKRKKYLLHRNLMLAAMTLSVLFLVSYISHHLLAGDTRFGDVDHDGILTAAEKAAVSSKRFIYYFILGTHIPLAGLILPFILFTAYRGLTAQFEKHKKLARITWPVWFYVAVTGVVVYLMIEPYYY